MTVVFRGRAGFDLIPIRTDLSLPVQASRARVCSCAWLADKPTAGTRNCAKSNRIEAAKHVDEFDARCFGLSVSAQVAGRAAFTE